MSPFAAQVGERYSDDSGWERLVVVDRHEQRVQIRIEGGEISFRIDFLEWLQDALRTANYAAPPKKEP